MQLWYVCKENQLLGPFGEGELHSSLKANAFGAHDWVRKAEDVDWKLAHEIDDFKTYFTNSKNEKLPFEENWHDKWVLLQLNVITNEYYQSGPFTTAELLSKIYKGSAEYTDFVWQQGMTEWKRLGAVEAFIPKDTGVAQITSETTSVTNLQTISSQVMTHKPKTNSFYEQIPLFEEEAKFPLQKTQMRFIKPVDKFPEYYKPVVNKRKRWWMFSFFCFILSLAIAIWGKNSLSLYL
jgi:hypothetical protein